MCVCVCEREREVCVCVCVCGGGGGFKTLPSVPVGLGGRLVVGAWSVAGLCLPILHAARTWFTTRVNSPSALRWPAFLWNWHIPCPPTRVAEAGQRYSDLIPSVVVDTTVFIHPPRDFRGWRWRHGWCSNSGRDGIDLWQHELGKAHSVCHKFRQRCL